MGSLYRPTLKSGKPSARYWVKYYVNGRAVRESTRTDDKDAAKRFLKTKEGAAAIGAPILPRIDRIRYDEVAEDLRTHYKTARDDHAVPRWAKVALGSLDGTFTGHRLVAITPILNTDCVHRRQAGGRQTGPSTESSPSWGGCSGSPTSTASSPGCP
jgi:hypothetical protein